MTTFPEPTFCEIILSEFCRNPETFVENNIHIFCSKDQDPRNIFNKSIIQWHFQQEAILAFQNFYQLLPQDLSQLENCFIDNRKELTGHLQLIAETCIKDELFSSDTLAEIQSDRWRSAFRDYKYSNFGEIVCHYYKYLDDRFKKEKEEEVEDDKIRIVLGKLICRMIRMSSGYGLKLYKQSVWAVQVCKLVDGKEILNTLGKAYLNYETKICKLARTARVKYVENNSDNINEQIEHKFKNVTAKYNDYIKIKNQQNTKKGKKPNRKNGNKQKKMRAEVSHNIGSQAEGSVEDHLKEWGLTSYTCKDYPRERTSSNWFFKMCAPDYTKLDLKNDCGCCEDCSSQDFFINITEIPNNVPPRIQALLEHIQGEGKIPLEVKASANGTLSNNQLITAASRVLVTNGGHYILLKNITEERKKQKIIKDRSIDEWHIECVSCVKIF